MPRLLQNGHFFLKPIDLVGAGVGNREPLDGHLPVPVPTVDFTHWTTPDQFQDLDAAVGYAPLVNNAVTML